jgi:hypothetical protein
MKELKSNKSKMLFEIHVTPTGTFRTKKGTVSERDLLNVLIIRFIIIEACRPPKM